VFLSLSLQPFCLLLACCLQAILKIIAFRSTFLLLSSIIMMQSTSSSVSRGAEVAATLTVNTQQLQVDEECNQNLKRRSFSQLQHSVLCSSPFSKLSVSSSVFLCPTSFILDEPTGPSFTLSDCTDWQPSRCSSSLSISSDISDCGSYTSQESLLSPFKPQLLARRILSRSNSTSSTISSNNCTRRTFSRSSSTSSIGSSSSTNGGSFINSTGSRKQARYREDTSSPFYHLTSPTSTTTPPPVFLLLSKQLCVPQQLQQEQRDRANSPASVTTISSHDTTSNWKLHSSSPPFIISPSKPLYQIAIKFNNATQENTESMCTTPQTPSIHKHPLHSFELSGSMFSPPSVVKWGEISFPHSLAGTCPVTIVPTPLAAPVALHVASNYTTQASVDTTTAVLFHYQPSKKVLLRQHSAPSVPSTPLLYHYTSPEYRSFTFPRQSSSLVPSSPLASVVVSVLTQEPSFQTPLGASQRSSHISGQPRGGSSSSSDWGDSEAALPFEVEAFSHMLLMDREGPRISDQSSRQRGIFASPSSSAFAYPITSNTANITTYNSYSFHS
jgi:hypothetical protein